MKRRPRNVTVRVMLMTQGGHNVCWMETVEAHRVTRRLRRVLEGYAKLVLRRRDKRAMLAEYDRYAAQMRRYCRHHGIVCPRLMRYLQRQLTVVRRGAAVAAKLRGVGV